MLCLSNINQLHSIFFTMRTVYVTIILLLCAGLVMFSSSSMLGAARGFELFISHVFPSLFPFLVCTCTLRNLGAFNLGKSNPFATLSKIFILSCTSGTPTGPLLIESCFNEKETQLSTNEKSIIAAICNLSSPVFIIGTVCTNMLGRPGLAYLVALSHYGTSAILLIIFAISLRNKFSFTRTPTIPRTKNLSSVLPKSISEASETMLHLGGTLIFFSVLIGLFGDFKPIQMLTQLDKGMLFGILEMTNGIGVLADADFNLRITLSLICALLSFGGICILMQVSTLIRISPITYILTKICHALISGLCCYLLYPCLSQASFAVNGSFDQRLFTSNCITIVELALCGVFASSIASLLSILVSGRTHVH